jgi:hypothetical protein
LEQIFSHDVLQQLLERARAEAYAEEEFLQGVILSGYAQGYPRGVGWEDATLPKCLY